MRWYPRNSPRAAARVVSMALLADGHLSGSELTALERHGVADRLGLDRLELAEVLQHLVEDLLATGAATWHGPRHLHDDVVAAALGDIDEPELRRRVLAMCVAVAHADRHASEGERAFLATAARLWVPSAGPLPAGARA
jgi:hypothetical protein